MARIDDHRDILCIEVIYRTLGIARSATTNIPPADAAANFYAANQILNVIEWLKPNSPRTKQDDS